MMMEPNHPKLQQLYDYWAAQCGGRPMPAPGDLDPVDMRFAMGNIILVDVIAGTPLRFRIRLHGTNLSQRVHFDLTDKMLDEMPQADFRQLAGESFTRVDRVLVGLIYDNEYP
jgi:hypothetical protein